MTEVILYYTSACHLCEVAERMFLDESRRLRVDLTLSKVDISEHDALFERYGSTIPVLRCADGSELGWPFSEDQLRRFIDRRMGT